MSATSIDGPSCESADGLKIRVYRVRLTAWAQRFSDKVDASGGPDACWPWRGTMRPDGYGVFHLGRESSRAQGLSRLQRAHRLALVLSTGNQIPVGMFACHRCDNPPCCNPSHLFVGTQEENLKDCRRKGRHRFGDRHHASLLTEGAVIELRAARAKRGSISRIAERLGVSIQTAWDAAVGKTYRHVPAVRT